VSCSRYVYSMWCPIQGMCILCGVPSKVCVFYVVSHSMYVYCMWCPVQGMCILCGVPFKVCVLNVVSNVCGILFKVCVFYVVSNVCALYVVSRSRYVYFIWCTVQGMCILFGLNRNMLPKIKMLLGFNITLIFSSSL
jgi:hypothetical protein